MVALLAIFSFAAFLYLIDYASRLLRPISILAHVGANGLVVIESTYPDQSRSSDGSVNCVPNLDPPDKVIRHVGTSGIVLAVNLELLAAEAERARGLIEFVPQVGDFVAVEEPLFNLYDGAQSIDEDTLHSVVAFGSERTMEQDPTFAFRIVVDIALRAPSPAINDPTTAVLAIDQLHRMCWATGTPRRATGRSTVLRSRRLRMVGTRHLRTDEILDKSGQLRVIFRTPNWEDFVHLAFSEIRHCGSNNLQIVRRLRAMIDNLIQTLAAQCHPPLQQELSLLDREITIQRSWRLPELRTLKA
jgi:uncharacterized membrane protein